MWLASLAQSVCILFLVLSQSSQRFWQKMKWKFKHSESATMKTSQCAIHVKIQTMIKVVDTNFDWLSWMKASWDRTMVRQTTSSHTKSIFAQSTLCVWYSLIEDSYNISFVSIQCMHTKFLAVPGAEKTNFSSAAGGWSPRGALLPHASSPWPKYAFFFLLFFFKGQVVIFVSVPLTSLQFFQATGYRPTQFFPDCVPSLYPFGFSPASIFFSTAGLNLLCTINGGYNDYMEQRSFSDHCNSELAAEIVKEFSTVVSIYNHLQWTCDYYCEIHVLIGHFYFLSFDLIYCCTFFYFTFVFVFLLFNFCIKTTLIKNMST